MASFLPKSVRDLIEEFAQLPGVGPKSAQRLVMHFLHGPEAKARNLADALTGFKQGLQFCEECWSVSEADQCSICENPTRSKRQICVVEEILDVVALEKTLEYKGVYHVLHGALSPIDGIGPEQLKVGALMTRLKGLIEEGVPGKMAKDVEVILATNPGLEGETTALYLLKLLQPLEVRITRIARGLPVGGDLDYADEMTLTRALQGRAEYC